MKTLSVRKYKILISKAKDFTAMIYEIRISIH